MNEYGHHGLIDKWLDPWLICNGRKPRRQDIIEKILRHPITTNARGMAERSRQREEQG